MNGKRLKTPTVIIIYQKEIRRNFINVEFASCLFMIREVEKAVSNSSISNIFNRERSGEILSYISKCFISGKFLNYPELRIKNPR